MRVSIEFDTKDPTGATISFDGEKQGYLSRVDLKLKLKGLNYMTIERYVGKGKEAKKFKEQIFRYDTNPAPTVPSDFIPGNLEPQTPTDEDLQPKLRYNYPRRND